ADADAGAVSSLPSTEIAHRIGFTAVGELSQWQTMNGLISRPPFTGQITYAEDRAFAIQTVQRLETEIARRGLESFASEIEAAQTANPTSAFLAFHAAKITSEAGAPNRALSLLDAHDRLAPASAETTVLRAWLLARQGRPDSA